MTGVQTCALPILYLAKKKAEKELFANIEKGTDTIYRVAKQLSHKNQDVVGEKCVFDDNGSMAFNEDAKKIAWQQHYNHLRNIEFPWSETLPHVEPVIDP